MLPGFPIYIYILFIFTILNSFLMKKIFTFFACLLLSIGLLSQEQQPLLNIHLDPNANVYDPVFLTNEVRFVNYVSDRRLSDVQVQSVVEPVGNGAIRYRYIFFGYRTFAGQNDTVVWHSDPAENFGSIREKSLRAFKQGLLPYLLQTPMAQTLDYSIQGDIDNIETPDPWNRWTFNPRLGLTANGRFLRDTNGLTGRIDNRVAAFSATPSFSAWRIGRQWRLGADIRYNYFHNEQSTTGGAGDFSSTSRNLFLNLNGVYALSRHWSVGAGLSSQKNWFEFFDQPFSTTFDLGLEYNLFPYQDFFRRRLLIGYSWRKSLSEPLFFAGFNNPNGHSISVAYAKVGNWGYLELGTRSEVSFDFNNWTLFSIGGNLKGGINLSKNLFLTLQVNGDWGNNDFLILGLGGTPGVLSNQIRSGNYDYQVGISYFFGSGYRNIINPRLGGQF